MIRHRIVHAIGPILFISVMAVVILPHLSVAEEPTKHELTIEVPVVGTPGLPFDWRFAIKPGEKTGKMDLYAALLMPEDGILRFLSPQGITEAAVPYKSDLEVPYIQSDFLSISEMPSSLPGGQYVFYAALVTGGADPLDAANWSSNLAQATFHYTSFWGHQPGLVATAGYPAVFIKAFGRQKDGTLRVYEGWVYWDKSLSVNFINGVFVEETTVDTGGITIAPTPYRSENYHFDTSRKAIEARHGKPLSVYEGVYTGNPFFNEFPANTYLFYKGLIFGYQDDTLVVVLAMET